MNTNELFNVILHDDKYIICLGNQRISNYDFDTIENAWDYIHGRDWQLILNCCSAMIYNALTYHKLIDKDKYIHSND